MNDFINKMTENLCLTDDNVSLEAKGFYYSMLLNMYSGNKDIKEVIRNTNEDIDFVSKLIMELLKNGYLFIGINGIEDKNDSIFIFNKRGED